MRLLFATAIIFTFAGATAIKKPHRHPVAEADLPEIAFLSDINSRKNSEEIVATEEIEVPVSGIPEEDTKESENPKENAVEEVSAEKVTETPAEVTASAQTQTYTSSHNTTSTVTTTTTTTTRTTTVYYNDDADSPYADQVYVDDNGVEINNPTEYPIPNHTPSAPENPADTSTDSAETDE